MTNPLSDQGGNFLSAQPINALEAISNAEISQQVTTAKRYPRNIAQVKAEMLDIVQLDEETAAACFYSLPRGGKNIQGPSIRLAEVALSCFGNIRAGSRIIETVTDGGNPYVTVQAVCHDLQKNVAISIEKRRRIVGKKHKGGVIDEDDINLAANAGSAIAIRDAIFKVVPGALIRPIYDAARRVAIGDARTLSDRRSRALEAFAKMGVPAERVLASIEKTKLEEVTLDDLEVLLGTFTAIKEGSISIENAFPLVPAQRSTKVAKPEFGEPEPGERGYKSDTKAPEAEAGKQPAFEEPSGNALAADARPAHTSSASPARRRVPRAPEKESAAPPAAEAKAPADLAGAPAEPPPAVKGESLQAQLFAAVRECNYDDKDFLAGLKLIEFPEVQPDAELLFELSEETCAAILKRGAENLMADIRDAKWMKGMK